VAALAVGTHEPFVERITIRSGDGSSIPAIHARPEGVPLAAAVLIPDIMGVRPLFDEICRRVASHGIAVVSPEPFAHFGDAASLDFDARQAQMRDLRDEVQLDDIERAANRLVVEDGVADIAVLGFCMGGMYTLKAAATGRFDRAVPFYGMIRVPENWRSPELRDPLDTAAEACPTLAIFGGNDPFTPTQDIDALRAAWDGFPDHEVVVYPEAEHGFVHDPQRPAHRPDDAADAWHRALAFLLT
jgi:carboxymethylenebutenolidase